MFLRGKWNNGKKKYLWYLLSLLFSFGLAGFWLMPFLSNLKFFPVNSLANMCTPLDIILSVIIQLTLIYFGWDHIVKKKDANLPSILSASLIIIFLNLLPIEALFPNLPIQTFRFMPICTILLIFLTPFGINFLIQKIKNISKLKKLLVIISALAVLALMLLPKVSYRKVILTDNEKDMINFAKELEGRTLIEAYEDAAYKEHDTSATFNYLSSLIEENNTNETLWGIFRESSINSPFIQPLRNSFSEMKESFGVICLLCKDKDFYDQPFSKDIKRASLFGVNYFLIRSDSISDEFDALVNKTYVEKIKEFGDWTIYKSKQDLNISEQLEYEPVLTFTNLDNNSRDIYDYDWLGLNEEWFFHGNFKHIMALAKNPEIDKSNDIKNFKNIFIVDYKYEDLNSAKQILLEYARNNNVFLLQSNDQLYNELTQSNTQSLNIFPITKTDNIRDDMKQLLDLLDQKNFKTNSSTIVKDVSKSTNNYKIYLDNNDQNKSQIYLKVSYFPWWKGSSDEEIYLASPVFMLIMPNDQTGDTLDLNFIPDKSTDYGRMVSVISFILLIVTLIAGIIIKITKENRP